MIKDAFALLKWYSEPVGSFAVDITRPTCILYRLKCSQSLSIGVLWVHSLPEVVKFRWQRMQNCLCNLINSDLANKICANSHMMNLWLFHLITGIFQPHRLLSNTFCTLSAANFSLSSTSIPISSGTSALKTSALNCRNEWSGVGIRLSNVPKLV